MEKRIYQPMRLFLMILWSRYLLKTLETMLDLGYITCLDNWHRQLRNEELSLGREVPFIRMGVHRMKLSPYLVPMV